MADPQLKTYLPGLNGIRAIAASMVVFSHIDQFSDLFQINSVGIENLGLGWKGVTLFFTLSGFLISYLLFIEKSKFSQIDFLKFYMRRILRIWPIYFLIIFLSVALYFVLPANYKPEFGNFKSLYYFLTFTGNVGYILGLGIITLTPLWSVGVEEQFYLFWPWLIEKSKKPIKAIMIFLLAFLFLKLILRIFENDKWYSLIIVTSFSCMAIGGIGAWLALSNHKVIEILNRKSLQLSIWVIFVLLTFSKNLPIYSIIQSEIYSIVSILIILNVSFNPNPVISLENKLLNFIGIISYGIYVYHMMVIFILSILFRKYLNIFFTGHEYLSYIIMTFSVFLITIIVANISYKFYEIKFINYKEKFSKILSTNKSN